jgi:hypothetical protein
MKSGTFRVEDGTKSINILFHNTKSSYIFYFMLRENRRMKLFESFRIGCLSHYLSIDLFPWCSTRVLSHMRPTFQPQYRVPAERFLTTTEEACLIGNTRFELLTRKIYSAASIFLQNIFLDLYRFSLKETREYGIWQMKRNSYFISGTFQSIYARIS